MSHFEIDLQFKPMVIAEDILNTLYTETSAALEIHNLTDAYAYVFIPVGKRSKLFVKVTIDTATQDVSYYVKRNPKTGDYLPAMDYMSAVRELRQLMVG